MTSVRLLALFAITTLVAGQCDTCGYGTYETDTHCICDSSSDTFCESPLSGVCSCHYVCWGYSSCSSGCTFNDIDNGVCNDACNNDKCDYDGQDCYCAPGCKHHWLADGQCDSVCDNAACGYDNADCPIPVFVKGSVYFHGITAAIAARPIFRLCVEEVLTNAINANIDPTLVALKDVKVDGSGYDDETRRILVDVNTSVPFTLTYHDALEAKNGESFIAALDSANLTNDIVTRYNDYGQPSTDIASLQVNRIETAIETPAPTPAPTPDSGGGEGGGGGGGLIGGVVVVFILIAAFFCYQRRKNNNNSNNSNNSNNNSKAAQFQTQNNPTAVAAPTMVVSPAAGNLMSVQIPAGFVAGQTMLVQAPNGIQFNVQVPPGTAPGSSIQVQIPGSEQGVV